MTPHWPRTRLPRLTFLRIWAKSRTCPALRLVRPTTIFFTASACRTTPPGAPEETGGDSGCATPRGTGSAGSAPLLLLAVCCLVLYGIRRRQADGSRPALGVLLGLLACLGCSEAAPVIFEDLPGFDGGWDSGSDGSPSTADGGTCVPDCQGKECGKDGCGGICAVCPAGISCTDFLCSGTCDDECEPSGATSCAGDGLSECGQFDDDGCLDWGPPEPCVGAGHCVEDACVCEPNCAGRQCGYDGCEGSCGTCASGTTCSFYHCTDQCVEECDFEGETACSGDGYVACGQFDGDECLEWGPVVSCGSAGQCVGGSCACQPDCEGKVCGDDGCGGSCGSCGAGKD